MSATRIQSLETLRSLSVAPIFVQAYAGKQLPKDLDIFFGPPEEFFLGHDPDYRYKDDELIALLDDGNFGLIVFYDPTTKCFVRKYVEAPDDQFVYSNWQQYLADLLISICENTDSDEELEEIAKMIGFKHLSRTIEFLDNLPSVDPDNYEIKKAAFLASIDQ